ncbi:MAG: hypothetical protein V3Q69_11805 [Burkholderia sp.]
MVRSKGFFWLARAIQPLAGKLVAGGCHRGAPRPGRLLLVWAALPEERCLKDPARRAPRSTPSGTSTWATCGRNWC